MHAVPGGLCTAWKRKGYTIDGCLHHLAGVREFSPIHPVDGTEHRADIVVSACDWRSVIYDMLEGRFTNRLDMNFHIALGVNRDMRGEPCALTRFLRKPVTILDKERDYLSLEIFNFDPSFAPEGKTVIKGQVEMVDVATPVTVERYTGNHHGMQAGLPKGKEMSALSGGCAERMEKNQIWSKRT